jgi:hypothetical protein
MVAAAVLVASHGERMADVRETKFSAAAKAEDSTQDQDRHRRVIAVCSSCRALPPSFLCTEEEFM